MWASSYVRSVQNDAGRQAMRQAFVMTARVVGTSSSRVRIAQLSLVTRLEIQIPNSGLQNGQRRPSFHFPVHFFVIGCGACLFYSGA